MYYQTIDGKYWKELNYMNTLKKLKIKPKYIKIKNKNVLLKDTKYVTEITEDEYYKKTGYNKKELEKLKKSVYPYQIDDYILLQMPEYFDKEYRDKYVSVDYEIVGIVKYLWKHKIQTGSWGKTDNLYMIYVDKVNKDKIEKIFTFNDKKEYNKMKSIDDKGYEIWFSDENIKNIYKHIKYKNTMKRKIGGKIVPYEWITIL